MARKFYVSIAAVLAVVGVVAALYFASIRQEPVSPSQENVTAVPEAPKTRKVRIEGRYLFSGTVVWARRYETWSTRPDGTIDYAFPFRGLGSFEREKYDAWMADLECASGSEVVSQAQAESRLTFNCRPEFLAEAAQYFDYFNLSNNHTLDLGADGLDETRRNILQNGMYPVGDFEPANKDNTCEIMALPVRVVSETNGQESSEKASLPVAFCAWHYFFRLPQPGEIEHMKQYADIMPVFAFLQAGAEYRPAADSTQKAMARTIADQGPEFVVGNSAHWVQDGEVYKGIPILYSTGNFIFDQYYDEEVMRSVSLDADMSLPYSEAVQKWLDLGAACEAYKDSCFETIKRGDFEKIDPLLRYDIVGGVGTDKLPRRADEAMQAKIEARVGWEQMSAQLNGSSSN